MSPNPLKQLAGQTAIYGGSSVLGRFLNYLLVPIHTRVFMPEQYGVVTEIYAYTAFLLIFLIYGMETAYFRYNEKTTHKNNVFSTAMTSILTTSILFIVIIFAFTDDLAALIQHSRHSEYIVYLALIVALDAIGAIPLARLRAENKPKKFAVIKLTNIGVNIGLNLFLLVGCPKIIQHDIPVLADIISSFHSGEAKVGHIFLANVFASAVQLIMLSPAFLHIKRKFSFTLWKEMIIYALPLLIFGLAGIMNETLDRLLLKYMLPENEALRQVGIYGACYKISILMTIFIQAYRYAAEPFFFARAKHKDAKEIYASMMNYFIIAGTIIFLGTMLYLDIIIHFINEKYWSGRNVIPILLLANLFLGIFYNLSIWYKLTNQTRFGAYLSIFGAIITVALNIYWIPKIGYMGSAWATLACYASMMILSYLLGKKYYPLNYDLRKALFYIGGSLIIYLIADSADLHQPTIKWIVHTGLFFSFLTVIYFSERKNLKNILQD
ncbi:MAG: polysaccharide biosynthesis C-terminal domain-containing protein [Bacteroidales bacterium]